MTLNLQAKDTYHVFDEFGMLIIPSDQSWEKRSCWKKLWDKILKREWIPTWSNKSKRDSLGRRILAGLAYGFSPEMISGIEACYRNGVLYRHPELDEIASRDHHSYFYIYRKWTNQELPDFPRMRGMNLWMKSLRGKTGAEGAYYLIYIPGAIIGNAWLRFYRKTGGIKSELTNKLWIAGGNPNYGTAMLYRRTKWQKIWAWIIFQTIPAYPLHNRGWQLYVMPESRRKEILKRILLKRVGKSNIMLRLLFEPNVIYNTKYWKSSCKLVTQEEVAAYPHLTGYRPGVYLDETCRRTIRELTAQESKYNTYEKDLIIWLYGIQMGKQ
ncbi:hypothetical protein KA005_06675 [bacterium]|nr:hypothetical protein [bacterium]